MKLENFLFKKSGKQKYQFQVNQKAYQSLTRNALHFFFLAGDKVSIEPLLTGAYEPQIRDFIEYAAACGFGDFLIDIGANVGLTSCQSGGHFKELHMYEPNPSCAALLRLNAKIALRGMNYHVHEFGLGEEDGNATLRVPVGNLGGAFIHDGANSYSDDILAMKDNFQSLQEVNYNEEHIQIRCAQVVLGDLFQDLVSRGLGSGVVKIDVEGYEPVILNALTQVSQKMGLVIIFESWDKDYDLQSLIGAYGGRANAYQLKSQRAYKNIFHRLLKKISPKFAADDHYQLIPFSGKDASGDLVLRVRKAQ